MRTALMVSIILLWSSTAVAQGRISEVVFESTSASSTFLLITDASIKSDQVEKLADADPSVIMIRFNDLKGKRQWVKLKDKTVKRALLHPSKERKNAVVLRIRFEDKRVNQQLLDAVRVEFEDAGVRVDIPKRPNAEKVVSEKSPMKALSKEELANQLTAMKTASSESSLPSSAPPPLIASPSSVDEGPAGMAGSATNASLPKASMQPKAEPSLKDASGASSTAPNPLPIEPEGKAIEDVNKTETKTPAATPQQGDAKPETTSMNHPSQHDHGLVFMPGVRTRDIVAGFTDMTLQLEKGLRSKPGIRRIAVFPFLALDPKAKRSELAPISRALLADRLVRRAGIISANRDRLEETIEDLPTDNMGRFAIDEARAVGEVVGADTLVIGTLSATGNGYVVDARAVDVKNGQRLVDASQEFEAESFFDYANMIREDTTVAGGIWRSALMPGWGQFYQDEYGRGVTYGAIFSTAFISGVAAGVLGGVYTDRYTSSNQSSAVKYRDQANRAYGQANVFLAIAGLMWASSIADAWITGKSQSTIDPRRYEEAREFTQ